MFKHFFKFGILMILPLTVFAQEPSFCEGDAVTTFDHHNGIVKQVFPDGLVRILIPSVNPNRTFDYDKKYIAKPISCLSGICAEDAVTTFDHHNGIVKQVFPDGVVKVLVPSVNPNHAYDYDIKYVAKPISCLSGICAEDAVTTIDHHNGIVKQVFPDGVVKVLIPSVSPDRTFEYGIEYLALYKRCSQTTRLNCRQ